MVAPGESESDFTKGGAAPGPRDVDVDMSYCGGVCGDVASGENRATRGGGGTTPACPSPGRSESGATSGERDAGRCAKIILLDVGEEYGISKAGRPRSINNYRHLDRSDETRICVNLLRAKVRSKLEMDGLRNGALGISKCVRDHGQRSR